MGSRPSSLLAAGIVCGVSMRKLIQRALDSRYVSYFRKNRVPAVTDSAPSTDEQIRYFIKRQRDTIWADEPDWDATLDKKIVEGTEFVELDVKITGFPSWEREGKARGNAEWVIPGEFALSQPRHEKRMLFLHGGAFAWGDPKEYRPCTSRLASVTGMPILVIDYRLAPEHLYPAQIEDSVQACLWALENGPFGSGPTTELYVAGDSSGGGTLYSMLINLKENPSTNKHLSRIAGSIAISPWVDLTCSHPSYKSHIWNKETMMGDVQFSYGNIEEDLESNLGMAKRYLGENVDLKAASPLHAEDLSGLPPSLILVGGQEQLLDDSIEMHKRLRADGSEGELRVFPMMWHVWLMNSEGCGGEGAKTCQEAILGFKMISAFCGVREHGRDSIFLRSL